MRIAGLHQSAPQATTYLKDLTKRAFSHDTLHHKLLGQDRLALGGQTIVHDSQGRSRGGSRASGSEPSARCNLTGMKPRARVISSGPHFATMRSLGLLVLSIKNELKADITPIINARRVWA